MREYFTYDGIRWNSHVESGLKLLLRQPKFGRIWIILSEGAPVGYLVLTYGFDLEFGGRQALITDLYIRPGFRLSGLGAAAIAMATSFCKKQELRTLELQVERHNKKALRFYKKLGFESHDRVPLSQWIRA